MQENTPLHLEDVIPRLHISDVHPLAVDVVPVRIPAADCDALRSEVCALVPLLDTWKRRVCTDVFTQTDLLIIALCVVW